MHCCDGFNANTGWDSYVYEYAATKGIPMEDCAVYTARDNWQCGLMQQCYMCSGAGNHTCRPVVRMRMRPRTLASQAHACTPVSPQPDHHVRHACVLGGNGKKPCRRTKHE